MGIDLISAIALFVLGMGGAVLNQITDGPAWLSTLGIFLTIVDPVAQFIDRIRSNIKRDETGKIQIKHEVPPQKSFSAKKKHAQSVLRRYDVFNKVPTTQSFSAKKKHAQSVLRRYDVFFELTYLYFIVSFIPCADIIIGRLTKISLESALPEVVRLIMAGGESMAFSDGIGNSAKAAIIACWFLFWISFMFISSVFSICFWMQTRMISEEGHKRLLFSFLFALLGLFVLLSPQAADAICNLYDGLRSIFSVSPMIFGSISLFVFFVLPFFFLGNIRKYRAIYNDSSNNE